MKVKDIQSNSKVADLVRRNPHIKDSVERAVKILKNEKNAVPAVLEAARALIDGKITIFFSYKDRDEETAISVIRELRVYAARKLNIIFAAEFKKNFGKNWYKMLREGIKNAHWFILLLPDSSVDWDWCLFETGMFRAKMVSDKVNRLICLHHPGLTELPDQIKEFQAVKAESRTVQDMLKTIYIKDDPIPGMEAINPEIRRKIPGIARKIIKAISPPIPKLEPTYLQRGVRIRVKDPVNLTEPAGLEKAEIVEINQKTLDVFGLVSKVETWGKLTRRVAKTGKDIRWLEEICDSIHNAAKGFSPDPIVATFKGLYGGKMWRPVLETLYKTSYGSIDSFVILFVEEIGTGPRNHIAAPIQALLTTLKMSYRFRWEIIERFRKGIAKDDVKEFNDILEQMESEALSRGLMDQDALCKNFNTAPAKEIKEMFKRWYKLRNDKKTGELDIAIQEEDVQTIKKILGDMIPLNQRFIELTSDRLEKASKIP